MHNYIGLGIFIIYIGGLVMGIGLGRISGLSKKQREGLIAIDREAIIVAIGGLLSGIGGLIICH